MMRHALLVLSLVTIVGCKKKAADTGGGSGSSGSDTGSAAMTNPGSGSGSGSATAPAGPDPAVIARGEYIANVGACLVCHTPLGERGPDTSKAWAGGMEMKEVFGTWRSPNITPDKGTGIGNWTDDQILAAIREGVRPDGSHLFPIMPYMNYNRMTDADGKALVAYMRTLKPIENVVAPTKDLKMPQVPAPKPANAPDVTDDPAKHGEYLATLMHCNVCHTPMTDKGPDMSKMFAGGFEMEMPMLGTGKLYSSNITSDPDTGIGKWSVEQIASTLKSMMRPDGKPIMGPMMFYQGFWSRLDDKDLTAVATFIHGIPPMKNKVPASTFVMKGMGGPPPAGSGSGSAAPAGSGSAK